MNAKQMQMTKLMISEMNMTELRQIAEYVNMSFKIQISREAKKFSKGDKVSFDHPREGVVTGKVIKVNQKTVSVVTEAGSHWNVAGSLLKAA